VNREADRTTANEIEIVGQEKVVVHWADGHVSDYPDGYLRIKCPCASCTNDGSHTTGPIQLGTSLPVMPAKARAGIHPRSIEPVGYYAVRIDWSDGHNTGIYSFKYLREICPCAECRVGAGASEQ
jgi:DUF971 family protein